MKDKVYITAEQLNAIIQLNRLMDDNRDFKLATMTDPKLMARWDLDEYIRIIELYAYLYKHYDKLDKILQLDKHGNIIDPYESRKVVEHLQSYMRRTKATPAKAVEHILKTSRTKEFKC